MDQCLLGLLGLMGIAVAAPAPGPRPTRAEMARRDAWVREHLARARRPDPSRAEEPAATRPGLLVLANHGDILRNGRPDGRRIKLASTEFPHGLICHAPSKVVVVLPGPGRRFAATTGVDAHAGGGTVVFSVRLAGREAFRSAVLRGGEAGVPVDVPLGGAREFSIEAGDAGDGIACDHADWADASVTLEDGTVLLLSDLPTLVPRPPERTASSPPFGFRYGGRPSDALLGRWTYREAVTRLDPSRARRTQTYTDPETGLQVRCVSVLYADAPTVEWTVYLKNTGSRDTPLLETVQALDTWFERGEQGEFLLHRAVGSPCQENDYEPIEELLPPRAERRVSAAGGRPTNSDLCYFNLEWPGEGVIVSLGWPGQWSAAFSRDSGAGVRLIAGQETTRLVLHPGEEVRTPLVVLQFWRGGDWIRAQNIWRRWMIAHNQPRPGGKPVAPHFGGCFGNPLPRAEEELAQIAGYLADGVQLDYWFIDAGWYPCAGSWVNTGTWEPDPERFPRGLREVGDFLHERQVKYIVWFEPERAAPGTWLTENHPEWVLGGEAGGLVDLGNPEARAWVTERIDQLVTAGGIDVYRSDFNIDPLSYWQVHDAADRQGVTENLYVQGFLAFWDELLTRHPGMYIDTCASGGRRNDLETLRRAVPLLRSDWAVLSFNAAGATGQQSQTYGISLWIPYHGTGAPSGDLYIMRSSYVPAYRLGWDTRDANRDVALLKRVVSEFRSIESCFSGDFYPLTPYSLRKSDWMAWQYDRPDQGQGAVQAFRREDSADGSVQLKLRGLDPSATYEFTDQDGGSPLRLTGRQVAHDGLRVRVPSRPGSALLLYRKASRPR